MSHNRIAYYLSHLCPALPVRNAHLPTTYGATAHNSTMQAHQQHHVCTRPSRAAAARVTQHRPGRVQSVSQQSAAASPTATQQAVSELHPEAWEQCVERVKGMGFDQVAAETTVQRAFGWGAKARSYWRHEKRDQAPSLQQIEAVVTFLQGLGMDDRQVSKAVKAFPEVLGCAVDSQLSGNVAKLQSEWKLEGDVLRGAVLRNPSILGYNVDCLGDCAGECNRCWVRF